MVGSMTPVRGFFVNAKCEIQPDRANQTVSDISLWQIVSDAFLFDQPAAA
jgi:hypothetical protein